MKMGAGPVAFEIADAIDKTLRWLTAGTGVDVFSYANDKAYWIEMRHWQRACIVRVNASEQPSGSWAVVGEGIDPHYGTIDTFDARQVVNLILYKPREGT